MISLEGAIPTALTLTDNFIHHWLRTAYLTLSAQVMMVFGSLVALVFIARAYALSKGSGGDFLQETGHLLLKITVIGFFIKSWPLVDTFVVGTWMDGSDILATQIIKSMGDQHAGKLADLLQHALMDAFLLANSLLEAGSIMHPAPWLASLLVLIFSLGAVLFATIEIIISKLLMAILIALMPLFLCLKLFKPTETIFDNFLGQLTGYALVIVFVSISASMGMALMGSAIPRGDDVMTFEGALAVVLMSSISLGLIMASVNMAKHVGNAVMTSSGASQFGQHIGVASRLGGASLGRVGRMAKNAKRG